MAFYIKVFEKLDLRKSFVTLWFNIVVDDFIQPHLTLLSQFECKVGSPLRYPDIMV